MLRYFLDYILFSPQSYFFFIIISTRILRDTYLHVFFLSIRQSLETRDSRGGPHCCGCGRSALLNYSSATMAVAIHSFVTLRIILYLVTYQFLISDLTLCDSVLTGAPINLFSSDDTIFQLIDELPMAQVQVIFVRNRFVIKLQQVCYYQMKTKLLPQFL